MTEDMRILQVEIGQWHRHHFGDCAPTRIILKAVSEIGELADAHQKRIGSGEDRPNAAEIDAIGDVLICLLALCDRFGISAEHVVGTVWRDVKTRSADRVQGR